MSKTGLHTYSGVSSEARLSVRHAGITLGPPEIRRGPVVVPRVQAELEAAVRAEAVQGASHPLRAQGRPKVRGPNGPREVTEVRDAPQPAPLV